MDRKLEERLERIERLLKKRSSNPGEEEIPGPLWFEFLDHFTRRDELLVEILKDLRALLKKEIPVPAIPGVPALPEIVVPPVVPFPPEIPEVKLEWWMIDYLARRLQQLPNRLDKVDIDTSDTTSISLRDKNKVKGDVLLGFYIEGIGGGFTYQAVREEYVSPERTAVVKDKLDLEFDDLLVVGSGAAGTATIWLWWREIEPLMGGS